MDDEGSYPSAQRLNNGSVPHANATAPAMSVLIENNENGTPHENKNVRKIKLVNMAKLALISCDFIRTYLLFFNRQ